MKAVIAKRTGSSLLLAFGLIIAPLIFSFLIWVLIEKQNEMAAADRLNQAKNAQTFLIESRRPTLNEYANWDEFYRTAVLDDNYGWFDENIGSGMAAAEGRAATLLLDREGKALAGSWGDTTGIWSADAFFGPSFQEFFKHVRDVQGGVGTLGFLSSTDGPAIAQIARVLPHNNHALTKGETHPRYLLFVEILDRSVIDGLRAALNWPDFSIFPDKIGESNGIDLKDFRGRVVGHMQWEHPRPGHAAFIAALPLLAVAVLVMLGSTSVVYRRILRSSAELVRAEQEARHRALHDALTGIPNRRALQEIRASLSGRRYALVIDFDGFKEVNDTLGHDTGDALLVEMAQRMTGVLPEGAVLARIGGDEFAVLGQGSVSEGAEVGHDIMMRITRTFEYENHPVSISASIGVASVDDEEMTGDAIDAGELLRRADVAMYEAKRARSASIRIWVPAMDAERIRFQALSEDIRAGLDRGDFSVALQPLFEVSSGRISGFEALARWSHPVKGDISPQEFIECAERSKVIHDLGLFVLREACLKVRDIPGVMLSVNLSPVQLLDANLVGKISAALAETGFQADRLEVEVTEGYLIEQEDRALSVLQRLKDLGIRISLDDFGTGYSSLGYLRRYPIDKLKIDRSYITPVETSQSARDIVAAIVTLAHAHHLPVTAEGVETIGQAQSLAAIGCSYLQGYLIGKGEADPVTSVPAEMSLLEPPQIEIAV